MIYNLLRDFVYIHYIIQVWNICHSSLPFSWVWSLKYFYPQFRKRSWRLPSNSVLSTMPCLSDHTWYISVIAFPHHCLILLKLIGRCIYQTFYMFTWLSESDTLPTFAPFTGYWQKPVWRCSQSYLWQYDADIGVLGRSIYSMCKMWHKNPFKCVHKAYIAIWVVASSQGNLGLLF